MDSTEQPRTPPAGAPQFEAEPFGYTDLWNFLDTERNGFAIRRDYTATFINDENLIEARRADAKHIANQHHRAVRMFAKAMRLVDLCGSDPVINRRLAEIGREERAAAEAEVAEVDRAD
jgi:hypothetical protein